MTLTAPASRTALLERAEELDALDAAFAAATGSGGRLVLLAGEAGVGKTVLLRRFCERRAQAARILWGDCDALFTFSPLGPLVDIAAVTGGELAQSVADGAPRRGGGTRARAVAARHGDRRRGRALGRRGDARRPTLHLWLWYPNPGGVFNSTNTLVAPFDKG